MKFRIVNVQKEVSRERADAVFITDPYDIIYLTGFSNFSVEEREAFLLVTKTQAHLITDGRYTEAVKKQVPFVTVLERSTQKPLNIILSSLAKKHKIKSLCFDEDNLTVAEFNRICNIFDVLIPYPLQDLRVKKDAQEITAIQKACKVGDDAFSYIIKQLKEDMREKELALLIEMFVKKNGASLSFPSIVAFGANASVPHHQTGDTKLKKNSFVLLDFGTKVDNYCSDMTRTIFFGKPDEEQKRMHATVLGAQQAALDLLDTKYVIHNPSKKTVKASELDSAARKYIIDAAYTSTPHSLGHGTGLEVHEAPSLSPKSEDVLSDGMVFSVEPGIYIPNFGGVRIEDLFTIQNGKLVQLTKSPKEFLTF